MPHNITPRTFCERTPRVAHFTLVIPDSFPCGGGEAVPCNEVCVYGGVGTYLICRRMSLCSTAICCPTFLSAVLPLSPFSLCGVSVCMLCVCWRGGDASCFAFGGFHPAHMLWVLIYLIFLHVLWYVSLCGLCVC